MICPGTLCGHWVSEVHKFVSTPCLRPMLLTGSRSARADLVVKGLSSSKVNLVVTSYEAARSDADLLAAQHWNYVVLDEGHVIKNGRSKTAVAVKRLRAKHRLILSGTPIQNSVLELWSLFDFLMPGFLGSEKQFNARYVEETFSKHNSSKKTQSNLSLKKGVFNLVKKYHPYAQVQPPHCGLPGPQMLGA